MMLERCNLTSRAIINALQLGLAIMVIEMPTSVRGEISVSTEMRSHGLPDNVGRGALFRHPFRDIPNLSSEDYANSDLGNGVRVEVRGGELSYNSGDVYGLLDGQWPSDDDFPEQNVFFDPGGGKLLFDLTELVYVEEFNTYSRHRDGRTPQRFRLYGSADSIAPSTNGNLVSNGWELLTSVNMLAEPNLPIDAEASFDGVAGVSVHNTVGDPLGEFRFMLLEVRGVGTQGTFGTFYSEVDIVGSIDPIVPPKCDLSFDEKCDFLDLQLLMSAGDLVAGVDDATGTDLRNLNGDFVIDRADLDQWLVDAARLNEVEKYFRGDANLDGSFDTADLTQVFRSGQYEDGAARNSNWATGDWDGNRDFDSADLVVAFRDGGYELSQFSSQPVPEPNGTSWLAIGVFVVVLSRRSAPTISRAKARKLSSLQS